jgi:hypothetical protein
LVGRLRDLLVTLLLSAGWGYLPVAAFGAVWIPPFVHRLLPVAPPQSTILLVLEVLACLGLAVVGPGFVFARTMRDKRRVAGADRRLSPEPPVDAELASVIGAQALDLPALRAARRIVLQHRPDGLIERAEMGDGRDLVAPEK